MYLSDQKVTEVCSCDYYKSFVSEKGDVHLGFSSAAV